MKRQPEPQELMNDFEQALAYASADFSAPHDQFVQLFKNTFAASDIRGEVLDLGCGPADICIRFAKEFNDCIIHGIDAAEAMLVLGEKAIRAQNLDQRIRLRQGYFPDKNIKLTYETIISNSLLHHLLDPMTLWKTIKQLAHINARIFIMDLMRPKNETEAKFLLAEYAANEPEVLQHDFYHSLLAAYTPEEVQLQLQQANLPSLKVSSVSDRHLIVYGYL